MSKAEELASKLERAASNQDMGRKPDPKDHRRQAAAHLRALDASHQRLKEACDKFKKAIVLSKADFQAFFETANRGDTRRAGVSIMDAEMRLTAALMDARAALEQAKDLS